MFFVHFLYSPFLLFFFGVREPPSSVCLAHLSTQLKASENEPKEKALSRQVFFKDI
jgi:hypothetical protein